MSEQHRTAGSARGGGDEALHIPADDTADDPAATAGDPAGAAGDPAGAAGDPANTADDPAGTADDKADAAGDDSPEHESPEADSDEATGVGDIRDELPADLDPSQTATPYLFPNNSRRRIPAVLYAVIGLGCIAAWATADADAVLINGGIGVAGAVLIAVGLYHWQAGWDLAFDEQHALQAATREVGFPVGHASAQLGWRGLRSRPTWRILLYSNEPVPERRGLVLVDGIDGEIVDRFVESNPEDWSEHSAGSVRRD